LMTLHRIVVMTLNMMVAVSFWELLIWQMMQLTTGNRATSLASSKNSTFVCSALLFRQRFSLNDFFSIFTDWISNTNLNLASKQPFC
jgi:hypothetical protein